LVAKTLYDSMKAADGVADDSVTGANGGNWEIFTVRSGGTDLVRLTRSNAMEFDPSWASAALT
jgi:hypothetical protein